MDWGKGEYERTARELEPAAALAVDALRPHGGDRILDVACGTGNAALLAAQRGAKTVGIDASARLLEVAAQRARMEAVEGEWRVADIQDLPYKDDEFDGAISVFGVIFAEDPAKAAAELLRVTRPGGVIVVTAWLPTGPIADFMKHVSATVAEFAPPGNDAIARFSWSDADNLRELLGPETEVTDHQLSFKGRSPGAWVIEQAEYHPAWLEVRKAVPAARYEQMLDEITQMVAAANVSGSGFEIVANYIVARVRLPE